jgi:hypothetical protein
MPLVRKGHRGRAPFLHVADPGSSIHRFVHSLDVGRPGRQSQRPGRERQACRLHDRGPALQGNPGRPLDPFNHSFSISVECDDQAEIDRLWDALKEGGSVELGELMITAGTRPAALPRRCSGWSSSTSLGSKPPPRAKLPPPLPGVRKYLNACRTDSLINRSGYPIALISFCYCSILHARLITLWYSRHSHIGPQTDQR